MTWGPQACPPPGEAPGNGWEGVPLAPKCADQSMRPCASGGSIPTFMSWVWGISSCPRGSGTPLSAFLQSFCSSCSLRGHLAGIDAPHLFSLPQASISQLRCPNQELSVTHWFCFDFLVYFLESQSQASCLPSLRELLRNDQETWLERCPGLCF